MPEVLGILRKSPLLGRSGLACAPDVPTINLAHGCLHGCVYCYARGYSQYPGRGRLALYENVVQRLEEELLRRRRRPHAVCLSSASDAFQPVPELLEACYRVLELLLEAGVCVSFLTKGRIPRKHMDLLGRHSGRVLAHVGLLTLNQRMACILEPGAAAPPERLDQVGELIARGIRTGVRIDPIVPAATDDRRTLEELLDGAAAKGVREVSAGVLFLRRPIVQALSEGIPDEPLLRAILQRFEPRTTLRIHAERFAAWAAPRPVRETIFARLREIAGRHRIAVHICGCKNPDLPFESCGFSDRLARQAQVGRQLTLFEA